MPAWLGECSLIESWENGDDKDDDDLKVYICFLLFFVSSQHESTTRRLVAVGAWRELAPKSNGALIRNGSHLFLASSVLQDSRERHGRRERENKRRAVGNETRATAVPTSSPIHTYHTRCFHLTRFLLCSALFIWSLPNQKIFILKTLGLPTRSIELFAFNSEILGAPKKQKEMNCFCPSVSLSRLEFESMPCRRARTVMINFHASQTFLLITDRCLGNHRVASTHNWQGRESNLPVV